MSRTSICVSIHGMIGRLVCSRHGCGGVQGEGRRAQLETVRMNNGAGPRSRGLGLLSRHSTPYLILAPQAAGWS